MLAGNGLIDPPCIWTCRNQRHYEAVSMEGKHVCFPQLILTISVEDYHITSMKARQASGT